MQAIMKGMTDRHLANQIRENGCSEIAKCLLSNNTLRSLCLGGNRIGNEGCIEISKSLFKNSTLTSLDIESKQLFYPSQNFMR